MAKRRLGPPHSKALRAARPGPPAFLLQWALSLTLLTLATSAARAAATVSEVRTADGRVLVRLENPRLRIEIDPAMGARGCALVDKTTDRDWTPAAKGQEGFGLFMDHFWEQNWPGEFLNRKYTHELLPAAAGAAGASGARFATTATATSAGKERSLLKGLELQRTMTLLPDSPVLEVAVEVHNPTADSKVMGYWIQHILWAGGERGENRFLRPGVRGISHVGWDSVAKTNILGFMEDEFERTPTAGWSAQFDEKRREGMVFVVDYGALMFFYSCLSYNTLEWQYQQAAIPPGKTWTTTVTAAMLHGFSGLVHACREAVFDVAFEAKPDGLQVRLAAARLGQPVKAVRFQVRALKLKSQREVVLGEATLTDLAFTPKEAMLTLPGPFSEQIALKVEAELTLADGTKRTEHFEVFYGGTLDFAGINRTIAIEPMYCIPSQPRQMTFLKPDKIERVRQTPPRVLVVNGQDSAAWRAETGAGAVAAGAEVKVVERVATSFRPTLSDWPVEYRELMKYDAIVLANLEAPALGPLGQEMLRDYVQHGGGLVILGGMRTLGNGQYAGSRIAEVLPVEPGKPFEIQAVKDRNVTVTGAEAGNRLDGKPVLFAHRLMPRPGAAVMATAGGAPVVVSGAAGQGRVIVFGATTLGKAPGGGIAVWQDDAWPQALADLIRWAGQIGGAPAGAGL